MEEKTNKMLVPIDGSKNSERAIIEAKRQAKAMGGEITLLTVVKPLIIPYYGNTELGRLDKKNMEAAKKVLLEEAEKEFEGSSVTVHTKLRKGSPAEEILEEAEAGAYDLIIMGSRGLGAFSKTLLGSVSSKVLNHTKINVLIVH